MAKKKGVNASAEIHWSSTTNSKATNKEVKDALAKRGLTVTDALVSNVRSRLGLATKRRRKKKGAKGTAVTKVAAKGVDSVSVSKLLEASSFAAKVGGVDAAKKLLDTLARFK